MRNVFLGVVFLPLLLLESASPVVAATLFPEPRQIEIAPTQKIEVRFFLDTQDEDINALEGAIVFPTDLLELKEVRDGNSIVNFWVERPRAAQEPVTFSGIIPGGYRYPKGLVVSLVFEGRQAGEGVVTLEHARVLRNDGQGTEVPLASTFLSFTVSENPKGAVPPVADIVDDDPPEPFTPVFSHDSAIFDGKWFLSFATQDKGSGIGRYEVQETTAWGDGPWVRAESPFVTRAQDPSRPVRVKAVDNAGHERIAVVAPPEPRNALYDLGAALGILFVALSAFVISERPRFFSMLKK